MSLDPVTQAYYVLSGSFRIQLNNDSVQPEGGQQKDNLEAPEADKEKHQETFYNTWCPSW
jgi:hypothetical protein